MFSVKLKQSTLGVALLVMVFISLLPASGAFANSSEQLLSVENHSRTELFDRAALEALPQVTFETTTMWTEGVLQFSGPSLSMVLSQLDINERAVIAEAANDYRTTILPELIGDRYPIIATRINEEPFGVREKGPLWIVYPYDHSEDFQRELIFSSSVWQLEKLHPADE